MNPANHFLFLIATFVAMTGTAFCDNKDKKRDKYAESATTKQAKGDLDGAIADYTKALQFKPSDAGIHNNRGVARLAKNDFDGAFDDFTAAIRILTEATSNWVGAYGSTPTSPNSTVSNRDALDDLDAIKMLAYVNRGRVNRIKGNLDGALEDLTTAYELRPAALRSTLQNKFGIANIDIAHELAVDYDNRAITK
jgi:tetratricopeptide (TPR) repeat protein